MRIFIKLSRSLVIPCVESVRIWNFSGPHFPAFGLNNSEYGHFSCSDKLLKSLHKAAISRTEKGTLVNFFGDTPNKLIYHQLYKI